jgi:hypothetical protein
LAGIVQTFGLMRWSFLVPHLAEVYLSPTTSEAQRAAAMSTFEAFHLYAGVALGEHLGYLCTALWTLFISIVLLRSPLTKAWMGLIGIILAAGIAFGMLEPAGVALASPINAISYMLWSVWLAVFGVMLLVHRSEAHPVQLAAAHSA